MKDTPERALLKDGFLVWLLRGTPKESLFAGLAGAEEDDALGCIDEATYILWHVPFVLLAPYVPVYHVLGCPSLDSGEKFNPMAQLAVEAIV